MIYMFLAQGFEEVEALCPLDLCRRAGIKITTVGVGGVDIRGSHGITVKADISDEEFNSVFDPADLSGVILPGGMPGTENLFSSPAVTHAVKVSYQDGRLIAAICAAPSVPGRLGMLSGIRAVCFPGFENTLAGAIPCTDRVVRDGNFITAVGMGAALEFGIEIVAYFKGDDAAADLARAVLAPDAFSSRSRRDDSGDSGESGDTGDTGANSGK